MASPTRSHRKGKRNPSETSSDRKQTAKYPYEVDYNDHFETPIIAYNDIAPLLDIVASMNGSDDPEEDDASNSTAESVFAMKRKCFVLYDPYFCTGRSAALLRSMGFDRVVHEKRDFYFDISSKTVPKHCALVTNPPYSGDHKERCLDFVVNNWLNFGRPFFLLMPNYVASKEYCRRFIEGIQKDMIYLVPSVPYAYDHPEGTGHAESPFESMWFCCIGQKAVERLLQTRNRSSEDLWNHNGVTTAVTRHFPKVVTDLDSLRSEKLIPTAKRRNPKQRSKRRKQQELQESRQQPGSSVQTLLPENFDLDPTKKSENHPNSSKQIGKKRKKSLYRDSNGVRKKKRF